MSRNSIRTCIVKANLAIIFCPLVSITARKFNYLNAKGIQDEGEPDCTDWNMTLYSGTDRTCTPIAGSQLGRF